MTRMDRDRILNGLLWGAVAGCGEFTALFLTIIGRIHVEFVSAQPSFYVDPRGPIVLTKDSALTAVWLLTFMFAIIVFWAVAWTPRLTRKAMVAVGFVGMVLAVLGALADPWWGLVLAADALVVGIILQMLGRDQAREESRAPA